MNDQDDELRNVALAVVAGVVALVIAGVIALSWATLRAMPTASKNLALAAGNAEDAAAPFGPAQALRFEPGSDRLSADAAELLNHWSEWARANAAATVLISGLPAGDARLATLKHALEANGVAPERIVVGAPAVAAKAPSSVALQLQ
ncbi:MAG TPA: hypothetical protein VGP22_18405 [Albitalea sp.]|nr:hypothetical protein [Albitalea sp.]